MSASKYTGGLEDRNDKEGIRMALASENNHSEQRLANENAALCLGNQKINTLSN